MQWRPITGLAASARTWSSRLARDMLPGLIPPLVWSINVPVLSGVWVALIEETLGPTGVRADDLVRLVRVPRLLQHRCARRGVRLPRHAARTPWSGCATATAPSRPRPPGRVMARSAPRLARSGVAAGPLGPARRGGAGRHRGPPSCRGARRPEPASATPRSSPGSTGSADCWRRSPDSTSSPRCWPTRGRPRCAAARPRAASTPAPWSPGQDSDRPARPRPRPRPRHPRPGRPGCPAAFLTRFGHLSDSPNDCSRPTWAEDPDAVARLFATRSAAARLGPPVSGRASLLAATPALAATAGRLAVGPRRRRPRGPGPGGPHVRARVRPVPADLPGRRRPARRPRRARGARRRVPAVLGGGADRPGRRARRRRRPSWPAGGPRWRRLPS